MRIKLLKKPPNGGLGLNLFVCLIMHPYEFHYGYNDENLKTR